MLYLAENIKKIPSKYNGKVYKYITTEGKPLAFEKDSLAYDIYNDNVISKVVIKPKDIHSKEIIIQDYCEIKDY